MVKQRKWLKFNSEVVSRANLGLCRQKTEGRLPGHLTDSIIENQTIISTESLNESQEYTKDAEAADNKTPMTFPDGGTEA
ncbi:hypothetical protein AWENTII_005877 [Aspergillus wentii]|nr:hypothetical protein MW887_000227 [Aspergillus wentii]